MYNVSESLVQSKEAALQTKSMVLNVYAVINALKYEYSVVFVER
jgi:hypothetical protein